LPVISNCLSSRIACHLELPVISNCLSSRIVPDLLSRPEVEI